MRLPTGTVTFLFTDIEGSTDLWERYPGAMPAVLARHDELVRGALEAHRGTIFKTVGDGFYTVFGDARAALAAALAAQRATHAEPWAIPVPVRVRMALHSGAAEIRDGDYFGTALNRVARILAAGHGGQILLSQAVERLVSDGFPEGAALRDLGERSLRDLAQTERLFQLVTEDLPVDFPPLRTLDARRHNLPAQVSPLIGRTRELAAIRSLILRERARLVTLTGPGGIGKTRIALQLGADLLDAFRDGVFFVNLTSVRDPERLPVAVLQALGGKAEGDVTPAAALAARLREEQCLLLLDNFEQVVAAAPMVGEFLGDAPALTILVTSQTALRIRGEHEVVVQPLALPAAQDADDPERLLESDAVALFVQRARAVLPAFELTRANAAAVVAICRQLDGHPLAIELAAARIKLFPPEALLARLAHRFDFLTGGPRDAPDRHRTLRNAIRWSYDLLDAGDQALFRRLAVFDGGFTLAAAEVVCAAPEEGLDVVEGLTSLVDKSLIRQTESTGDEPRFERLRTVWVFAVELFAEDADAPVWRRRHAEYFAGFAQQFNPNRPSDPLRTPALLARLEVERYNLRAATEWALQAGDGRLAARLCAALPALWFLRGITEEGRDWPERTLPLLEDVEGAERADALNLFGRAAQMRGENSPRVTAWFEESLALYRAAGDAAGAARALMNLGNAHRRAEAFATARGLFEEALACYRQLGDAFGIGTALMNLGDLDLAEDDLASAVTRFDEARAAAFSSGDQIALAYALQYRGTAAALQGDLADAAAHYEASRDRFASLDAAPGLAWSAYYLANVARAAGEAARARTLYAEAIRRFDVFHLQTGIGYALLGLAALEAEDGRHAAAARLLGAADTLRAGAAVQRPPLERRVEERVVAAAVGALGAADVEARRQAGRAMPPDQAIALGLEVAGGT